MSGSTWNLFHISQVTVKVAAKARDEKNNVNKIKNSLGFITPLKIFIF